MGSYNIVEVEVPELFGGGTSAAILVNGVFLTNPFLTLEVIETPFVKRLIRAVQTDAGVQDIWCAHRDFALYFDIGNNQTVPLRVRRNQNNEIIVRFRLPNSN